MKRTTLVLSPAPRRGRELKELIEAISDKIPVKTGDKDEEIVIATENVERVQRILQIHGYEAEDKRIHETQKNKLFGAIELLGEKYTDDRPKEVKPPPSVHKRNVMSFVNRKARLARKKRKNTRVQGKRDRLDGKISALEDMLRYLRKR